MRGLFRWAVDVEISKVDPTRDVKLLNVKTEGFHVWTEDEVSQFEGRWPIGTRERLALDLLLYTGLRRGDAVRLGRQHVKDGVFKIKTEKNGVVVEAPILAPLARSIEAAPTGDLAFIAGERGKPMAKELFGNWFREACKAAGVPGSAHGLRKAGATLAAENGATTTELKSMFGWTERLHACALYEDGGQGEIGSGRHVEIGTERARSIPSPSPSPSIRPNQIKRIDRQWLPEQDSNLRPFD